MTVTQYIGAPYIPHGWTTWQPATAYDGMSVVEYNLVWYIAKQPVPIGTAPTGQSDDPYWAAVDRWNGQVEEYRQVVEKVVDYINEKENKYYLFVGDSFNKEGRWGTKVANFLNLTPDQYTSVYKGGIGFVPHLPDTVTFQSLVLDLPENIKQKVTHIVLITAGNDLPTNINTVEEGIQLCYTSILSACPNCRQFFVGPCIVRRNPSGYDYSLHTKYIEAMEKNIIAPKMFFMGSQGFAHHNQLLLEDGTHFTDGGYENIAKGIVATLNGQDYEYLSQYNLQYFTVGSKTAGITTNLYKGQMYVKINGQVTFDNTNVIDNMYTFTTETQSYLTGCPLEIPSLIYNSTNIYYGSIRFVNGILKLICNQTINGDFSYIGQSTFPITVV